MRAYDIIIETRSLILTSTRIDKIKKNAIFEDVHGQVELIISSLQGNFEMLKKP